MRLSERLSGWLKGPWGPRTKDAPPSEEGPCTHVVMLDGTMSSLTPGQETNVGLIYRLLHEAGGQNLYYEPGIQWRGWRRAHEVASGVGINRQIRRAYGFLAGHYKPGDRILLIGYSRGAYAVRALAGMIDRLGLLRAEAATPDRIREIYLYYKEDPTNPAARSFVARHCHPRAEIEAVCVFDTVRALGNRWPLIWRLAPRVHAFRSQHLGATVRFGYHALALHETRQAFQPELWDVPHHRLGEIEQIWFRGTHGIVGGQLAGDIVVRGLSNIPLVWMLEKIVERGARLPGDWQDRFPCNPDAAPSRGYRGVGRLFLFRRGRQIGHDPSERLHPSVGISAPAQAHVLSTEEAKV